MSVEHVTTRADWTIREINTETGEVIERDGKNLVTNAGRAMLYGLLFMLTGSAGVVAMAPGASSTAATVNDTRLTHELIDTTGRKALTSTGGSALSAADIINETTVIESVTYYTRLTCMAEWPAGEGTGHTYAEYGLVSTIDSPATPTTESGTLFNHYVDDSPSIKGASTVLQIMLSLRWG